jgi:hypothetical protein
LALPFCSGAPQAGSDNVRQGSASGNDNSESGRRDHHRERWGGDRNPLTIPPNSAELCFVPCS